MAWRNVLRNRRRSIVTIAAMAFALFVELMYAGLVPGYLNAMTEDITQLEIGDVQIHALGYRDTPSIYTVIEEPEKILASLDALDGYPSSARLLGGGLAASGEYSAGIAMRGVDPERDGKVCMVSQKVEQGQWLDVGAPKGVVVGKHLAKTLEVKPGSELLILGQATDGSMANDLYEVRGILGGVAEATDRATIYMLDSTFRDLMVMPTGAHQIIITGPRGNTLEETGGAVAAAAPELEVKTWKQLMPIIGQMLDSVGGMIYILYFIIYVAVGILVLNAMLMAVFERIREFGVLKAIGAGPLRVFAIINIEAAFQTLIALVVGFTAALPGMWWMQNKGIDFGSIGGMNMMGVTMRKVWYGVYDDPATILAPVIMLIFIVSIAVLYPAIKAAWISPVQAMRHR